MHRPSAERPAAAAADRPAASAPIQAHNCIGPQLYRPRLYSATLKGAEIFTCRSQYGARVMQVWLAAARPKTMIVTLAGVLESGNAKKNRVNLARFLCARRGVL